MRPIKNVLITLLVILGSCTAALAQPKGQLKALQEMGDGSVFKKYWGIEKKGDSYTGEPASSQCVIKFENNIHKKFATFVMNNEKDGSTVINSGFGFLKPNHYTEPSAFHSDRHNLAYVYIDGLMYALKNVKDPQNITSFKIEEIFVLMKPTNQVPTSGKAAVKALKSRNHDELVAQYLKEMKAVQEAATAAFTPEIAAEAEAVEGNNKAKDQAIKDRNAEYWASAEGQRNLKEMRQPDVVFINDTGSELGICYGSGAYKILKPGEKHAFSCKNGKVYRGEKQANIVNLKRTDKLLLDLDGKNCGTQINASSVL